MKTIPVNDLEAGIKFNKPVYVDGESLLVPENVEIRQKDIDRLKKWGIEKVSTDGEIVDDEKTENSSKNLETGVSSEFATKYQKAIDSMDILFNDCRKGIPLDAKPIDEIINNFYPLIISNDEQSVLLTTSKKSGKDELSQSAVNCMILSTVMGNKAKVPPHRLMNIAKASLVHDLGMTKVPQDILKKQGKLTLAELEKMKTHTVYAYRISIKELGMAEEVGRVAMSHHERWDGKGYPRGLKGKQNPVGARILSVTDAFIAMRKDRADRGSLLGYTAIRQILNDNSRRFDPDILKVFIQNIGIYPRGSIVILNNGAIGKIVQIRAEAPLRPGINVLVDKNGRKPKKGKEFVDLFHEKDLFITRAVDPKEIVRK